MNDFHTLMEELGKLLDIILIPDKKGACVLKFHDIVSVQIEPDVTEHSIVLASKLGEIPAGKFRETLLIMAMKYNNLCPRIGNFAYLAKQNELVLFRSMLMEGLKPETIEKTLDSFVSLAEQWKLSITRGSIPHLDIPENTKKPSLFDLNH